MEICTAGERGREGGREKESHIKQRNIRMFRLRTLELVNQIIKCN